MPDSSLVPYTSATAPRYRYYTTNIVTNTVIGEIPFEDVSFERAIKSSGNFDGKITITEQTNNLDLYNATLPGKTALYVVRDGVAVWGGIIWGRTYDLVGRSLSISASEFASYLSRRVIWKPYSQSYEAVLSKPENTKYVRVDLQNKILRSPFTLYDKGTSGTPTQVRVSFVETGMLKYTDYYRVIGETPTTIDGVSVAAPDDPNNTAFYIYAPGIPARALTYDKVTITAQVDTYAYLRNLLSDVFDDFTSIDFANESITPGIRTALDVAYKTLSITDNSNGLATIETTNAHGLVPGQMVQLFNVDEMLDGEYKVLDIPNEKTFRYRLTNPTKWNNPAVRIYLSAISRTALTAGSEFPVTYRELIQYKKKYITKIKRIAGVVTVVLSTKHTYTVGESIYVYIPTHTLWEKTINSKVVNTFDYISVNNKVTVTSVGTNGTSFTFDEPIADYRTSTYNIGTATTYITVPSDISTKTYAQNALPKTELRLFPQARSASGAAAPAFYAGDQITVKGVDGAGWANPYYNGTYTVIDSNISSSTNIKTYKVFEGVGKLYFDTQPNVPENSYIEIVGLDPNVNGVVQVQGDEVYTPSEAADGSWAVYFSIAAPDIAKTTATSGAKIYVAGSTWLNYYPASDQITMADKEPNSQFAITSMGYKPRVLASDGSVKVPGKATVKTAAHQISVGDYVDVDFSTDADDKSFGGLKAVTAVGSKDLVSYNINSAAAPTTGVPSGTAKSGTVTRRKTLLGAVPPVEVPFYSISASSTSGEVTVTSVAHGLNEGDRIVVVDPRAASQRSPVANDGNPVTITATTNDTFTYKPATLSNIKGELNTQLLSVTSSAFAGGDTTFTINRTTSTVISSGSAQIVTGVSATATTVTFTKASKFIVGDGSDLLTTDSVTGGPTNLPAATYNSSIITATNRGIGTYTPLGGTAVPNPIMFYPKSSTDPSNPAYYDRLRIFIPTSVALVKSDWYDPTTTGGYNPLNRKPHATVNLTLGPNTALKATNGSSYSFSTFATGTVGMHVLTVTKQTNTSSTESAFIEIKLPSNHGLGTTQLNFSSATINALTTKTVNFPLVAIGGRQLTPDWSKLNSLAGQGTFQVVRDVNNQSIVRITTNLMASEVGVDDPALTLTGSYGFVVNAFTRLTTDPSGTNPYTAGDAVYVGPLSTDSTTPLVSTAISQLSSRYYVVKSTTLDTVVVTTPDKLATSLSAVTLTAAGSTVNPTKIYPTYNYIVRSLMVPGMTSYQVFTSGVSNASIIGTNAISRSSDASKATIVLDNHGLKVGNQIHVITYGNDAITYSQNYRPIQVTDTTPGTFSYALSSVSSISRLRVQIGGGVAAATLYFTNNSPHKYLIGDTINLTGFTSGVGPLTSTVFPVTTNVPIVAVTATTITINTTYSGATIPLTSVSGASVTMNTAISTVSSQRGGGQVIYAATVGKAPVVYVRSYGEFPDNADIGGIDFSTDLYSSDNTPNTPLLGSNLTNVAELLDKYSNSLVGFDYRVDAKLVTQDDNTKKFTRTLVLIPRLPTTLSNYLKSLPGGKLAKGQVAPVEALGADKILFEYPGNIANLTYTENSESAATRMFIAGDAQGGGESRYSAASATNLLADGWPLLDKAEQQQWPLPNPDVAASDGTWGFDTETDFYKTAKRYLDESKPPIGEITISVNGSLNPVIGSYNPGDWCSVSVHDAFTEARLKNVLELRNNIIVRKINSIKVNVPNNPAFPEQIDLTLISDWQVDKVGE